MVQFNRDVRPILSENCFPCHGPDRKKRQAELRLDIKDGAFAGLGGYSADVSGRPDRSELFKRISAEDPKHPMPPVKSDKKLTPPQIEVVRQWIQQGAKFEGHGAFVPPRRPPLPNVTNLNAARNAIDHFMVGRLGALRLAPSREADRRTLIRRASFAPIGLPPPIAEFEAFVNDQRDGFSKVSDDFRCLGAGLTCTTG